MKSYSGRDDIIDIILTLRFCLTVILFVAFPQVKQQAERREPHLVHRHSEKRHAVIQKSGKQLLICYPTSAFFGSCSLSTFRFVPL